MHQRLSLPVALAAVAAVALKGISDPCHHDAEPCATRRIKREVEPLIGFLPSIILGALATAFALLISGPFVSADRGASAPHRPGFRRDDPDRLPHADRAGTRRSARSLGYLILENGIYIFGMLLVEAIPLVVEMGMLLDLFVGVFVISIIANHINQAFSSMDTRRLVSLKE